MPNQERALSATRGPVRARCPQCSAPVVPEVEACPSCAATRPGSGWQKVTELVVHAGGRDLPAVAPRSAPPVVRSAPDAQPQVNTVYLQAVSPGRPSSHLGRLALTFVASFVMTTVFVLGAWTVLVAFRPAPVIPIPRVEVIQVDRVVPVPVPVPVPVVEALPAPEPTPALAPAPAQRPAVVPVVVAEEPPVVDIVPELPVVVPAPAPAPVPVVREAPPAAVALAGAYVGKGSGRPLTIHLRFQPDGVLSATIERFDGASAVTAAADGEYELVGPSATILLVEQGVPAPLVYSGTATAGTVEGRMSDSGRNVGKFSVQK